MKRLFIIFGLMLQGSSLYAQNSSATKLLEQLLSYPQNVHISNITSHDRDELIRQLRLYATGQGPIASHNHDQSQAIFALIRLNDSETVDKLMSQRENDAKNNGMVTNFVVGYSWEDANQPLLIPRFAQYLPLEDGNKVKFEGGDGPYLTCPLSISSALVIVGTIKNSADFDAATKTWAEHMYNLPNYSPSSTNVSEFRKIMVDWWTANKKFFDAKDYKSVGPGTDPNQASLAPSPHQFLPEPSKSIAPTSSSTPAIEQRNESPQRHLFALAISIIVISAIGCFIFLRRK